MMAIHLLLGNALTSNGFRKENTMSTILELTASIVSAHVVSTQLTSDEMLLELQKVHAALKALETGGEVPEEEQTKKLSVKQAFKKDEVICMICGKGFKTLKRHLAQVHDVKPGQYRKQFGIPSSQALVAKSYSESRRKAAEERGLGDILAKAREKRAASKKGKPAVKAKASATVKSEKAAAVKKPISAKRAKSIKA